MANKIKVKPLSDRILIEQSDANSVTKGGIVLPDNAKEKPTKGKVLAVGPGRTTDKGDVIKMSVNVGDEVYYEKYAGSELDVDGEKYIMIKESNVVAICI